MNSSVNSPAQYVVSLLAPIAEGVTKVPIVPEVTSAEAKFGDFQSNVAMRLQKQVGRPPREIAGEIAEKLLLEPDIASAEVAGPGFINIVLADEYWLKFLHGIGPQFGSAEQKSGQKIQVEFISANPTGPLTLGNARGGFIGDVLGNVLAAQGHTVVKEYYFNDAGTQISKLIESYRAHRSDSVDEDTPYKGEYMQEVARNSKLAKKAAADNDETAAGAALTDHIFNTYIQPALQSANIHFDLFTNERIVSEKFGAIYQELEAKGLVEERDGAVWLKSTTYGDERDRVLIKTGGDRTYLANDIAYHYDIYMERDFQKAIKIWGADHAGQIPSLRLTAEQLFPGKELDFLIVQWVRLIKDGQEFKISKRAGTYVTVEELINRVGVDIARWFMLMRSNDTHMDFDLDLAEEQSQKNPFWYVMYAYVRLTAILRQSQERGLRSGEGMTSMNPTEREIVRAMAEFPSLLESISKNYEVHKLTFYGQQLARDFHEWYEQTRVVELPASEAAEKLYFLEKLKSVLDRYFEIMGVTPQERM